MTALITILFVLLFVGCIAAVIYYAWQEYYLNEDMKQDGRSLFMTEYHKIKSQRENGS
jgi:Tfp pilus assembly protein PilE